jgi:hypothetical protein
MPMAIVTNARDKDLMELCGSPDGGKTWPYVLATMDASLLRCRRPRS